MVHSSTIGMLVLGMSIVKPEAQGHIVNIFGLRMII